MASEVLVVYPHRSPFIDQDVRILESMFDVSTLEYRHRRDRFMLLRRLIGTQVVIAWFALGYAYAIVRLRHIHRAGSILIAGGWDVESRPELQYGEMQSEKRLRRTSFALTTADRVLAVSSFTLHRVLTWAPTARADVLYHGFDPSVFTPEDGGRAGVLTVSRVSLGTWKLKGLSVFVEAARRLPQVPFTVVGDIDPSIGWLPPTPPNLKFTGYLPQDRLIELYRRTRVYAQLSAVESFGCALAEAMLCGCVPVVTDRGALLEVVGVVGQKVRYGDVDETVEAIRDALNSQESVAARERIRTMFPLNKRKQRLEMEVRGLMARKKRHKWSVKT